MIADFVIKKGNLSPTISALLRYSDDTIVDLSGGVTVKFLMRAFGSTSCLIERYCTILSVPNGEVQYAWQEGDTDIIGKYEGEFQVTMLDGTKMSVPNNAFISIFIMGVISTT